MNTQVVWDAVLSELELTLSRPNYTTWFQGSRIAAFENGEVTVSVHSAFVKSWLERKYNDSLPQMIQKHCTEAVRKVTFRVDQRSAAPALVPQLFAVGGANGETVTQATATTTIAPPTDQTPAQPAATTAFSQPTAPFTAPNEFRPPVALFSGTPAPQNNLNPRYTFETFIVGKNNELPHAAAQAVAENPGTKYNPLFMYGDVGLGKTHLAQAVGHVLLKRNPGTRILYASCEKFINDYINAVKHGGAKEFKDTYRNVDLLIVDDIQFLSGKDGTQEEFFHTFNTLHQANKQVILTSDRPPKQIPALESRLTSRFECGMIADIGSPDLETRIAILETKCRTLNYNVDPEAIRYIASVVQHNVRELEGALNKILAYSQLKNIPATIELAKQQLSGFGTAVSQKTVTAKHLLLTVSQYFDLNPADMLGKCRERRLAFPRQILMYLMRMEMSASYPAIGAEIGGRDHTTAIHAFTKIAGEIDTNPKLRQDIELIKQRLYNT
jgi:chromosomal replication initiator protein